MENTLDIRNPEHYMDTTPHDAINGMKPKAGEVWTYGQWYDECLILKDHDGFCIALKLIATDAGNCIPVGNKWTNPAKIIHVYNDGIHDFVRKSTLAEFEDVMCAVSDALDVSIPTGKIIPPFYESDLDEAKKKYELAEKVNNELRLENAHLQMQLDVMKSMYYELIDRMMGK